MWFAPNPAWNAFMRNEDGTDKWGGVVCPTCFIELGTRYGVASVWTCAPAPPVPDEAALRPMETFSTEPLRDGFQFAPPVPPDRHSPTIDQRSDGTYQVNCQECSAAAQDYTRCERIAERFPMFVHASADVPVAEVRRLTAENEALRKPDLRIVYGFEAGLEEGRAERDRLIDGIRALAASPDRVFGLNHAIGTLELIDSDRLRALLEGVGDV